MSTSKELVFHAKESSYIQAQQWGFDDAEESNCILAVHGWADSSASFALLAPLIVERALPRRVRIVAVDLPGHGRSGHRQQGAQIFGPHAYVGSLIDVLDQLRWRRCSLIGHSMGGVCCSLLASAFPDRVLRFVSLDILGPPSLKASTVPMQLRAMILRHKQLLRRKPRVYASLEHAVDRRLESNPCMTRRSATLLAERGTVQVDLAEERVDEEEQSVDGTAPGDAPTPGVIFRHDQRIHLPSPMYAVEEQVLGYLQGIAAPTLVIWAEERNYRVDEEKQRRRELMIDNLTVVHVKGTHHVHLDEPERVLAHICVHLFDESKL